MAVGNGLFKPIALLVAGLTVGYCVPAEATEDLGSAKSWGPLQITLTKASAKENTAKLELLLKNISKQNYTFSAMDNVRVLSVDGDIGMPDISSMCFGLMAPAGKLKCRLIINFDAPPSGVTVQIVDDGMSAMLQSRTEWKPVFFTTTKLGK